METFSAAHKHTVTSTPKLAHESIESAGLLWPLLPGLSTNEIQLHWPLCHLKIVTLQTFTLETIGKYLMTTNKKETKSHLALPSCHLFGQIPNQVFILNINSTFSLFAKYELGNTSHRYRCSLWKEGHSGVLLMENNMKSVWLASSWGIDILMDPPSFSHFLLLNWGSKIVICWYSHFSFWKEEEKGEVKIELEGLSPNMTRWKLLLRGEIFLYVFSAEWRPPVFNWNFGSEDTPAWGLQF